MAAGLVAVVPAKRLELAKSRLAGALTTEQRAELSIEMLRRVASRISNVAAVRGWAIVSGDERALALAHEFGGQPIVEPGEGLNVALGLAREWALAQDASGLLVVPSDVPLITTDDVDQLVELASDADVVIAPSNDEGSNALLLQPPDAIPFRFGRRSAAFHRFEAHRRGLSVRFFHSPTLSFDVDTPQDYAVYAAGALALP